MRGHLKETVPTPHPSKKILGLVNFDQEIAASSGNVAMQMMKVMCEPMCHFCEMADNVETKWFALTNNYHAVKANVSVLMEDDDVPVLPFVLTKAKCYAECCTRPKMRLHSARPGIRRRRARLSQLHSLFRSHW